jgi:sugar phosphate isomerase/epimerase
MLEADVGMPSVGLLADLYHMLKEKEPMADIVNAGDFKHTHIALLEDRYFPLRVNADVAAFFEALKKIGYAGSMSIEGRSDNLEQDAAVALKALRSAAGT